MLPQIQKGKGFAGGMKRHNFSGNRATHGVSIFIDLMDQLVNAKTQEKYLKEKNGR